MRQHRAGEGKLLDLEGLKLAPQTLSTSDSDLFIARVWLACEIEVRRKVDHRGDAATVAFANLLQSLPNALVGGEVDFLECRRGGSAFGGKVEADYIMGICKAARTVAKPAKEIGGKSVVGPGGLEPPTRRL
jgi:hypothetical protein